MAGSILLNLDLGTNGLTATATDVEGRTLAAAEAACETLMSQPSWVEQRPEDWWRACVDVIAAIGREIALADVVRIAVRGDLRGAVFLDGEMDVIRPAILSTDARWGRGFGSVVEWLRANQTIAFKRLQHLLTPLSYVRYRLTGELAVDADDASATGLFDAASGDWSQVLREDAEINVDLLPEVAEGRGFVLHDDVAVELGLSAGALVVAGGTC